MTPVLSEMIWYDNQVLLTKNEYWSDLVPIVRGVQNSIKYRLRSYYRSEEDLLPWEFTAVEK